MPYVELNNSPLGPDDTPVTIHYREMGSGRPMLFLHGGWGYEIYPVTIQAGVLTQICRLIIPDRTGYGLSPRLSHIPMDFHGRAAIETLRLIDALELERPVLWGHSDGAVIGAMIGLRAPDRISGLILEAFHFYRAKPRSRSFFETMASNPRAFGERVTSVLSGEHGEDYWEKLIMMNGKAWLGIAQESASEESDLYDGRLSELAVPTTFIHGSRDPRTEPSELDAVRAAMPETPINLLEGAGHSPHTESAHAASCSNVILEHVSAI